MNAHIVIAATDITPEITVDAENLIELRANLTSTMSGSEMVIDQCDATLLADGVINIGRFIPKNSTGLITSDGKVFWVGINHAVILDIPYGTELDYYEGDALIGKFYVDTITRVSRESYQISCMSALGFLDRRYHAGGVYNGDELEDVIDDIVGDTFAWTSEGLSGLYVNGWLPYDTARNNLHQLLLAYGINLLKDTDGTIKFAFLNADNPKRIPEDRTYMSGRVEYPSPATAVEVTEHSYTQASGTQLEEVYSSNGSTISGQTIVFNGAPVYDIDWSGWTFTGGTSAPTFVNCNCAIVTGSGVVKAKKYTHYANVIRQEADNYVKEKVVSVSDCTVITFQNSYFIAKRLLEYYSMSKKISGAIVLEDERPGDYVTITDAFGDSSNGLINQMSIVASENTKADTDIVIGYVPSGQVVFTQVVAITENQQFTVPADVSHVRIVCIGGGTGGSGGYDGEQGPGQSEDYGGDMRFSETILADGWYQRGYGYPGGRRFGGAGGEAGEPGTSGKVKSTDVDVVPGETISCYVGTGGAGGTRNGGLGSAGTHSYVTIPSYSAGVDSNDGSVLPNGFHDLLGGDVYAEPGAEGYSGGAGGGMGDSIMKHEIPFETSYAGFASNGQRGGSVAGYRGGKYGTCASNVGNYVCHFGSGGGGGGAAYGNDGGAGNNGTIEIFYGNEAWGGTGGNGANAVPLPVGSYGSGGAAGNGGGGGGAGGGSSILRNSGYIGDVYPGDNSLGGTGSSGTAGGDGIILIYM